MVQSLGKGLKLLTAHPSHWALAPVSEAPNTLNGHGIRSGPADKKWWQMLSSVAITILKNNLQHICAIFSFDGSGNF